MNLGSCDLTTMNYYCPAYGFRINSFAVDTEHVFFDVIAYSITHNFKRTISDNNTNQLFTLSISSGFMHMRHHFIALSLYTPSKVDLHITRHH